MNKTITLPQEKLSMNNFHQDFILAYFKENIYEYSFSHLAKNLGVSRLIIDEYIDQLITDGCLQYNDNKMLSLTLKGRLRIMNRQADFLTPSAEKNKKLIHPEKALPIDAIYIPENFISKLL